jgi:hypothetical protein
MGGNSIHRGLDDAECVKSAFAATITAGLLGWTLYNFLRQLWEK